MSFRDDKAVRSIAVVGGGSAGYLSALYLKHSLPSVDVTLIESTRIPVIGVGEATTPLLLDVLHRRLGFPVQEFFEEAKPTIKLGIRFEWGNLRANQQHFNSTFGPSDLLSALVHSGDFNNLSFASMLMEGGKVPFTDSSSSADAPDGAPLKPLRLSRGYAYHVDNKHFLAYLKRKLLASGCKYLDTEIERVECTPGCGEVAALHTAGGKTSRFDLYIDCSGFRSLLLEQALGTGWVDYSPSLKTDSAVLGTRSNEGQIAPYTTSTTMRHGWLWNTPMQQEDHLGYVFSSAHCSDEEALNELREHCSAVNAERVIRFKPGRHTQSWSGNVVAVGNAFAFIEPLQSTGLHMVLRQLRSLAKGLVSSNPEEAERTAYNIETNTSWDHLRWFVAMHFRFNQRMDTPFWRDCQETTDLTGLQDYLADYVEHGPLSSRKDHPLHDTIDIDDIFSVYAHDVILTGCGVNDRFYETQKESAQADWPLRFRMQEMLRAQCVAHRELLQRIEQAPGNFLQDMSR